MCVTPKVAETKPRCMDKGVFFLQNHLVHLVNLKNITLTSMKLGYGTQQTLSPTTDSRQRTPNVLLLAASKGMEPPHSTFPQVAESTECSLHEALLRGGGGWQGMSLAGNLHYRLVSHSLQAGDAGPSPAERGQDIVGGTCSVAHWGWVPVKTVCKCINMTGQGACVPRQVSVAGTTRPDQPRAGYPRSISLGPPGRRSRVSLAASRGAPPPRYRPLSSSLRNQCT